MADYPITYMGPMIGNVTPGMLIFVFVAATLAGLGWTLGGFAGEKIVRRT